MNDNVKTIAFLSVAVAAVGLAFITTPEGRDSASADNKMGQSLLEGFDPRAATGIRIVEIDDDAGDAKSIEISQTDKGWYIKRPGKTDYPADADNQLQDVSTILLDVRIHDLAAEGSGEHAKLGVLDPNQANPEDAGIGRYLALKNSTGSNLAELIIGDEVKDLSGLRYVRKPGENSVYMAEIENVSDISSKFVDWVEKDFLDLDKWDVKRITLDNYEVAQGRIKPATQQILDYNSSEWKLSGSPLAQGEELEKEKLDALKDALDDLEIIDVESKPAILASSLRKGNEFVDVNNAQALQATASSLQQKGFYAANELDAAGKPKTYPNGKPMLKVVSNKGEILVGMKDGVEYVLRFGETYRGPEDDENATGDSRYIYAFARVSESLLDPPELEPVPSPLPANPASDGNASAPPATADKNATVPKGNKGDEGEKGAEGKPDPTSPPPAPPGPPPNIKPPSIPPIAPPPPPPAVQPAAPDANGSASSADSNASNPAAEYAKKRAERDAEIARIKAENTRKQNEYNDKVKKAKERAKELNESLAGWYYVISNEVYEKIRLDRADFVKIKEDANATSAALPEEVKASHVLVSYKGAARAGADVTRTKEEAQAKAEELRKQIVDGGKDFATVARENSDGPSKTKGGDLGKFKFETMAKPFSEAAFALEIDTVSEVVETTFGFHVIKRTE